MTRQPVFILLNTKVDDLVAVESDAGMHALVFRTEREAEQYMDHAMHDPKGITIHGLDWNSVVILPATLERI